MKKLLNHFSSFSATVAPCLLILFLIANVACGGPNFNRNIAQDNTSSTPKMTRFERDIKSMRTANFKYIYVFRRKNGGVFDAEDKTYLRENRPAEANRFIISDEEKAYIAGSNYPFPEESMKILKERFDVEDISTQTGTESNENQSNNGNSVDNSANK